ncbi:hypothetical protein HD806DRAFT_526433 [Xylariaceae sp. AK1471]|nr:hypothetical protein HD806DRAFT_526433 [Xylariaceae sp. AK1471]
MPPSKRSYRSKQHNSGQRPSAPASGGGGEPLPSLEFNQQGGRSRIGGLSNVLPRLALNKNGKPEFPPGKGPLNLETLHPISCPTAVRTGSLAVWGGNETQHRRQRQEEQQQYHGLSKTASESGAGNGEGKGKAVQKQEDYGDGTKDTGDDPQGQDQNRRDYKAESDALERAREVSRLKEEARARREGRLPRFWSSHPSRITPIMENNKPVDPKDGRTPWVD